MAVYKCPHCTYKSNHKWVVTRHMDSKHKVQQPQVEGYDPQYRRHIESPPNFQQSVNLPYPAQHPYNPQPVGHLYGERPVNVQSPGLYTYHNQHHIGGVRGLKRHDDILSVASTWFRVRD